MQVWDGSNRGRRGHRTVDVRVNSEQVPRGQAVLPMNHDWLAAARFKGGAGVLAFKSPQSCRRKLRVQLLCELEHADAVFPSAPVNARRSQSQRNRQRVDVPIQRCRRALNSIEGRKFRGLSGHVARQSERWSRRYAKLEEVAPRL